MPKTQPSKETFVSRRAQVISNVCPETFQWFCCLVLYLGTTLCKSADPKFTSLISNSYCYSGSCDSCSLPQRGDSFSGCSWSHRSTCSVVWMQYNDSEIWTLHGFAFTMSSVVIMCCTGILWGYGQLCLSTLLRCGMQFRSVPIHQFIFLMPIFWNINRRHICFILLIHVARC